jgi:hypothetical protein
MSKSEARIKKAEAKRSKDSEKTARLLARPLTEKTVRFGANPTSIFDMRVTCTVVHADTVDQWESGTQRKWDAQVWQDVVEPKLLEWCKLTWKEIDAFNTGGKDRHKMHHSMQTDVITSEAQCRLIEIEKYEDNIFRFRLGNLPRLWGFRRVAEFQILWFDPKHEIYPTDR